MEKVKKYILVIAIILTIIIVDQIVKIAITNQENDIIIFQGVLKLNYNENTGIAFGMASGNTVKVIITEILVLFVLFRFLIRQIDNMEMIPKISISFIMAGGISNFIDRMIRGRVIDYIDISELISKFPIFNIADIFIVLGFIIFAITIFVDLIKMKPQN